MIAMEFVPRAQSIRLEMLNYTVRIRVAKHGLSSMPNAKAWARRDGTNQSTIWLMARPTLPLLVHEIMHVIQHIVDDYHLSFTEDMELTAYAAEYIFVRATGHQYKRIAP